MNQHAELLNFVYQNSQMGVITTAKILGLVQDEGLKTQLLSEHGEYQKIHDEAGRLLNQNGYDEKGISAFEKIRTYLMIDLQTLADKSSSHIAEMMLIGSTMGIVQATRNLKKYRGEAEQEILSLMEMLLRFEENNFQALKAFL